MKKLYILLTRTNTVPARFIRAFTPGEFSHVSIAFSPRNDRFYSYARRKINNPAIAGLVSESINKNVFAKYPDTHCAVYSVNVSDEGYERAKDFVRYLRAHRNQATYSFIGAAAMKARIKVKRKYKFTCSQFVGYVLDYTRDVELPKDPYLMLPSDFQNLANSELVFDGLLKDCVIPKQ